MSKARQARLQAYLELVEACIDAHDAAVHAETAPDPERCAECARQQAEIERIEALLAE